ncbi:uncharacterized protein [Setaria viridis]|uniref:uncharacterized protein n=1 Tax=Setaria viridis TaxID=4556 RepID=UPI003B3A5CF3
MAPFGPWAGIPSELLLLISDGFGLLESYSRARGVCTAWRAANPFPRHRRCVVGSSNGWLAVDGCPYQGIYLIAGEDKKVPLLQLNNDGKLVPKIVFAPKPTPDDYVAVAICDLLRLAYTKTRDMKWMILDVAIGARDWFVDLAYDSDAGKVYCVNVLGDVHGDPNTPFFGGNLYQVWRNTTSAVSWDIPGGGQFRMAKSEIFVLKYDPERQPCWDAVKDLGGYSVFVGKNQPVVLRPEDAPGVRANCVYWINEGSRNKPMVFDIATGISTLHPSADKALNPSCRPVCWYFLNDKIMSVENNGRKRSMGGEDCVQVSKSQEAH